MCGRSADVALLAGGVDRNQSGERYEHIEEMSPSSRRAWIEITHRSRSGRPDCVALLAEGVDRNSNEEMSIVAKALVALLAEGVDRNQSICQNERYRGSRPPRRGYR